MTRRTILLDKSFLQGSGAQTIRALWASHQLLMPDVLFYELISSPEPGRSRCFAKFPPIDNPISLVKNVGAMLRHEIEFHQPFGKPSSNYEDIRFRFNPKLAMGEYIFPPEAHKGLEEENKRTKCDVTSFIERVRLIPSFFPDLLNGSDSSRKTARQEAELTIANDVTMMTKFYGQLDSPLGESSLPPANIIDTSWAIFRWLQVQLLFTLDLYCRYGGKIPEEITGQWYTNIEHDMLDAQYLILGVLEGSFATREKKLQRFWSLLCPDGVIYTEI